MKTILVPTDFSTYGFNAAHVAASLAERTHAKILLQHNVQTMLAWDKMNATEHRAHQEILDECVMSENKLSELIKGYSLRHLDVTKVVTQGVTYEKIITEATRQHADVIVLGSHGNEMHDRFFIGSNIQKVLREAPCPVLSVQREVPNPQWKKLVIPLSLDQDVSKAFESITRMAADLGSTIYLLYVNSPGNFKNERDIRAQMQSLIHSYPDMQFETAIYSNNEVETGILEYVHEIGADWIALISHDRKHKDKYLVGITETIAFRSDIPLLAVSLN
jgi:nucleotide-binding universal stress UspA family protein